MSTETRIDQAPTRRHPGARSLPRLLLQPVPLALIQPVLDRIVSTVAGNRPELFSRLGSQARMRFLIDADELPFVLLLRPDPMRPTLRAYRRHDLPAHDASIAGTFLTLLDMIDGSLDGDALFFSRDLRLAGNTEAIVTLRNALDDLEGSMVDTVLGAFGPLAVPASLALGALRGKTSRDRARG